MRHRPMRIMTLKSIASLYLLKNPTVLVIVEFLVTFDIKTIRTVLRRSRLLRQQPLEPFPPSFAPSSRTPGTSCALSSSSMAGSSPLLPPCCGLRVPRSQCRHSHFSSAPSPFFQSDSSLGRWLQTRRCPLVHRAPDPGLSMGHQGQR